MTEVLENHLKSQRGPHHSHPCRWPTRNGKPCAWRAEHEHSSYGPICSFHFGRILRNQHLTKQVLLRFCHPDFTRLKVLAEASGRSIQELLRSQALGMKLPQPLPPIADNELLGALGKIGNNLNQIARGLNVALRDAHLDLDPALFSTLQSEIGYAQDLLIQLITLATERAAFVEDPDEDWAAKESVLRILEVDGTVPGDVGGSHD